MGEFSKSEIIRDNPIGEGLAVFRRTFSSACRDFGYHVSLDEGVHFGEEGKISEPATMLF